MILADILSTRADKLPGSSPSSPSYWISKLFGGGGTTTAGVDINEENALEYSPVWAAVSIIAGALGVLPFAVFRRVDEGKEKATRDPVYKILHDRTNPLMDPLIFRETIQAHVLLWGNGYAEIERNRGGVPINLWPLRPDRTKPRLLEDGTLIYEVTSNSGGVAPIEARDMLHIRGLGWNGLEGYSVVGKARENLGLGVATEQFGASFFGNGATPSGVLQHPQTLDAPAQQLLLDSWNRANGGGPANRNRTAILEEGMEYNAIGIPPEDAQFLETRVFSVRDVARWFQVPAHMLVDNENATFSNIEHQQIEFVTWTMMRWLRRWELECNYKLFSAPRRSAFFTEFIVSALLRGDTKSRFEAHKIATGGVGWMQPDEVRRIESMNSEPELQFFTKPLNVGIIGEDEPEPVPEPVPGEDPPPEPDEPDAEEEENARALRAAHRESIRAVLSRMCTRLEKASKHAGFDVEKHRPVVIEALTPPLNAAKASGLPMLDARDVANGLLSASEWSQSTPEECLSIIIPEPEGADIED